MTEVQYKPQKLNIWNHDDARKNVVKRLRQQCAGTGMIKSFPTKVTLEECETLTLLLYQPERRQQPLSFDRITISLKRLRNAIYHKHTLLYQV